MKGLGFTVFYFGLMSVLGCSTSRHHETESPIQNSVTPFLMFQDGNAEQAMQFYTSVFPESKILNVNRHGPGGPAPEGQIELATFEIMGQQIHCSDSPPIHDFNFTPSMSLYIECSEEEQLDVLAQRLSDGGEFLMPPGSYGFSKKFTFFKDRFGVSWQVNLPHRVDSH